MYTLAPNGDRVVLIFIAKAPLVQVRPEGMLNCNNPALLPIPPNIGYLDMGTDAQGLSEIATFDFGTVGPLAQMGWKIRNTGSGESLVIWEVMDNQDVRRNLGCQ